MGEKTAPHAFRRAFCVKSTSKWKTYLLTFMQARTNYKECVLATMNIAFAVCLETTALT